MAYKKNRVPPKSSPPSGKRLALLKDLPSFVKPGHTHPDPGAKYVILPGVVEFKRKRHSVFTLSAEMLAALYGVSLKECEVICSDSPSKGSAIFKDRPEHVYLAPRADANFDLKKVHNFPKVKIPKKVLKKLTEK